MSDLREQIITLNYSGRKEEQSVGVAESKSKYTLHVQNNVIANFSSLHDPCGICHNSTTYTLNLLFKPLGAEAAARYRRNGLSYVPHLQIATLEHRYVIFLVVFSILE